MPISDSNVYKITQMLSAEEMIGKLQAANLLGISEASDLVVVKFIDKVAGRTKSGLELAMIWDLIEYETMKGCPIKVLVAMALFYQKVIETVIFDPEVAKQAQY